MTRQTITKLNQLNQDFYNQVAADFDDSRQYYWAGWEQVMPVLKQAVKDNRLTVIDVGCGNGRFGQFVSEQLPGIELTYIGIDNNDYLLQQAKVRFENDGLSSHSKFLPCDIVTELLTSNFHHRLQQIGADEVVGPMVIVSFGVLHHLPSTKLRQNFFAQLAQLTLQGRRPTAVIATAWQFLDDELQRQKIVDPQLAGILATDLETNDFILSWNRGSVAYRYCHFVDEAEIKKLTAELKEYHLTVFEADGKSGHLNRYLVLTSSQE